MHSIFGRYSNQSDASVLKVSLLYVADYRTSVIALKLTIIKDAFIYRRPLSSRVCLVCAFYEINRQHGVKNGSTKSFSL